MPVVDAGELTSAIAEIFSAAGSPDRDARITAEIIVDSNLTGHESHGVATVARYVDNIRDGIIATNIRRALRLYPDRVIVVFVGDAHILGDGHLLGRVGAPSLTIAARFSPVLARALADHPPAREDEFLRTDRGVLFFSPSSAERVSGL